MPTYLIHGFRWPRDGFTGIRVHAIVHNLEDCSVEYIQNENSKRDILDSFRKAYPELMKDIELNGQSLDFIEQYDPEDTVSTSAVSQPHAFVADKVVEMGGGSSPASPLSLNVEDVITAGPGLTAKAWEAFAELRDKIAGGETIGWWVVYNGDPDRAYDSEEDDDVSTPTQQVTPGEIATAPRIQQQHQQRHQPAVQGKEQGQGPTSGQTQVQADAKPLLQGGMMKELPTRGKTEQKLPDPKQEVIPEPPKLKEVAQKTGFRKKFFGRKA